MSNEKMRQEFEAWAFKEGYTMRTDGADYYARETIEVYAAWQASRAALCVELPKNDLSMQGEDRWAARQSAINACRSAIESTGVRAR